MGMMCSAGEDP